MRSTTLAVLVLALLASAPALVRAQSQSAFEGHFTNADTYRLAMLDLTVQADGSLVIGQHGWKSTNEADPKAPREFVFEPLVTVQKDAAPAWLETLRSFEWNSIKLVIPKAEGATPYLLVMGRR